MVIPLPRRAARSLLPLPIPVGATAPPGASAACTGSAPGRPGSKDHAPTEMKRITRPEFKKFLQNPPQTNALKEIKGKHRQHPAQPALTLASDHEGHTVR